MYNYGGSKLLLFTQGWKAHWNLKWILQILHIESIGIIRDLNNLFFFILLYIWLYDIQKTCNSSTKSMNNDIID